MSTVITISQILIYLILTLPIRFFLKVKGEHDLKFLETINKKEGLILISNHTSRSDPFVILSSLPFSVFYKLVPIHFMTTLSYLNTWLQRLFLTPLGCFPHKTDDPSYSSINKSIEFLKKGERVFIFPEGKRVKALENSETKRGVGILASQGSYSILPIRINGIEHLTLKRILRRQVNTTVSSSHIIGNHEARTISTDPSIIAKELMKRVYEIG